MRIVGGRWRGRRLTSVGAGDTAGHLRPTSDRVRESLFNLLINAHGDPVTGARVLDLFAGTGALGLEALSRGASHAVFVDDGAKAQKLLSANIGLLGAGSDTSVLRRNATRPGPAVAPCDLVFLDPPYGKGLGQRALEAARQGGWLADGAVIAWEENARMDPPDGFESLDHRRYGDTWINLLCWN